MSENYDRPAAANSFVTKAEQRKKRKEELARLHEEDLETELVNEAIIEPEIAEKVREKTAPKSPLVRKTYYITEKQYKDIRMLSVTSGRDTSTIIRAAINEYLAKEMKK